MSDLKKKAIILSLIGFASGILIGLFFYLSGSEETDTVGILSVPAYFVASGIFGMVSMGGSAVYDIESWSITRCTVTHALTVSVSFIIFSWLGGWLTDLVYMGIIAAIMFVIYVIIWLICYNTYKRKVRRMNRDLEDWKTLRKRR